mgnify:CR=1 FL=1|jgi:hypothetical protein
MEVKKMTNKINIENFKKEGIFEELEKEIVALKREKVEHEAGELELYCIRLESILKKYYVALEKNENEIIVNNTEYQAFKEFLGIKNL